ncbi:chitin synthase [Fusarium phyllophilum]|uniref:chitin synthase n=1 Tax=Fusarium phyllophilum TaxID=47803 RepID=A0A8H5MYK4_9HYPO|nr:chitin synthase [Fusarium phyllophilum]
MANLHVTEADTAKRTSTSWRSPTQQEKSYPPLPSFFTKGSNNKYVLKDNDGHFHDVSLGDILERTSQDDARSSDESIGPSLFTSSLSYKSSFAQTSVSQFSSNPPTKPSSPSLVESSHQRDLVLPRPRLPDPVARRRDSGSVYSVEDVSVQAVDYTATATQTSPRNSILKEIAAPAPKIEIDSEFQNLDEYLRKYGQRKVTRQKHIMTAFLISVNFIFIFASWWWPRYYYVYIPFISFPLVLNCIMIASIICFTLKNLISAEKIIEPDHLEDLIMIMPCYNETLEECTKSLDSLVDQVGIDNHKRGIMVICDGRVRGPGMEKTTAQYLNEDIFVEQRHREKIARAYRAWDGQAMDVEISWGYYKGVPFYCIVKEQNQGKRDSLIVVRSFLYKFNIRNTNPTTIFSSQFLLSMTDWLTQEVKVNQVDHLIGMDADTIFDKVCISELLKESKYPNTVGVCGYVAVDFKDGNWNLWSIYQNAEYTIAQGLRRLHQSIATKKVSCLPGCCQLLKICDMTCGDKVLVELFGYYPRPLDGMITRIRATASEDRNHICQLLTTFPEAQTRQALRARAYTDVPHSWSVFLSQRRRWTLGATSNDLLLTTARHCQWWERILAFSNVLTWCLNVFVIASIGCMIVAFMHQPWWIIMAFAGIMIVPLIYYVIMAVWLPQSMLERFQYLFGLFIFVVLGPFLNIAVMVFAVFNMDSFGWGKTRKVITETPEDQVQEKQRLEGSSSGSNSPQLNSGGSQVDETAAGVTAPRPTVVYVPPIAQLR